MNAREHVTQEIKQGTEAPPRRTANPLTGETLQRAFLLSIDRFHELYEGKYELVLKTQIDRKKYLRALAQYKRYTDNGLTPLDIDEVAGLSLGPNFSSIWRDHPELHP